MLFSDTSKTRGRLTSPEREEFAEAASELGIDHRNEICEGEAIALVLQNIAAKNPNHTAIVSSILSHQA